MTEPGAGKPLRVFIYVQHLSGVGHLVRCQRIGLALARRHRVAILDGGLAVDLPAPLQPVTVPALFRRGGELAPLDDTATVPETFERRRRCLEAALLDFRPDVVLVEHFPFSKWELEAEIEHLLRWCTQLNPGLRIIGSLRDIAPRTQHEQGADYDRFVLDRLHRWFDALLVHGDPELCRLEDFFTAGSLIRIPVIHTGMVAAAAPPAEHALQPDRAGAGPYVVASAGGGPDLAGLLPRVVEAWGRLRASGYLPGYRLLLFSGLAGMSPELHQRAALDPTIVEMGFDPAFRRWLSGASLSISCAGYNTCADLLATGVPALLLPNPAMSDQGERARRLVARGLAHQVGAAGAGGDPLAEQIRRQVGRRPPRHDLSLDGARQSALQIERLASGCVR